ncbi:MAG TPA: SMC-Scp complex subunit ScpB [Alphaproteobacteria bacterium]|nr:SMC-Scp complex subunit ScpB [Alphaproteobacteria bacterium]
MNQIAEDEIEEIVDQIAEEMQESEEEYDASHEGESEAEEIMEEMAEEMEEAAEKDFSGIDHMRMLEAIMFASAAPLSPQAILERMPSDADLNVLLPQLKANYEGRGVELVEIGGQWALRTAQDVGDALTIEKDVNKKMSKAALETMAIIAYHQPITRAEIENIRGVATHRGTLDILMEMGWVKPGRRRETPGRPLTWVTTTDFLDHFQLESLMDLPGLDDLKASGLLDRRAAIETIPDTGDLFDSGDVDAEEVLDANDRDLSDDDAYDEQTYKEIQARGNDSSDEDTEAGEDE